MYLPGEERTMKTRSSAGVCATVFAALTIIGCCLSTMARGEKRRTTCKKQLDEAVQNWEGEGGAIVAADEDEEREIARA
jgi:hypothetical protein